ncbi:MAG: glycosyltransferase [Oscillospiraceae bacterium]|nr:glycosyltransferase [Oscillospiraceae bacterium]
MKHLILICNLENIDCGKLRTSSSGYELGFAKGMAPFVKKVSIVSPKAKEKFEEGNIVLYPCHSGDLMKNAAPVADFAKNLIEKDDNTVILFWGYNPVVINSFCRLKSASTKVVSMIYDTHSGELSGKKFYKKLLINLFYGFGKKQVNRLDGIFLFKEKAAEHLNLKIRRSVILPTVDIEKAKPFVHSEKEGMTFLYGGTLCDYNGINELLAAFSEVDFEGNKLKIFGAGPLKNAVETAAEKDPRITYGGLVPNGELMKETEEADVLLNLRKVPSIVNDFAFPSKITEYMMTGKVVVSTDVSGSEDFKKAVYLLKNLEKEEIVSVIKHICCHREEFSEKAENALLYLKKHHDSKMIFEKAHKFMFEELFKNI